MLLLLAALAAPSLVAAAHPAEAEKVAEAIRWLGQAGLRIDAGGVIVYVDPHGLGKDAEKDADVILVTHDHWDHFSRRDILRVAKPSTLVIAPFPIEDEAFARTAILRPGESRSEGALTIAAVPAYTTTKRDHPKDEGHVGYLVTFGGVTVYAAGDTERIPEMKDFSCDVAFLPLGPNFTMSGPAEAAEAALDVAATIAVPYHWGTNEGTKRDALKFQRLLEGKVKVLVKEDG
jgi:L-ascorbate metabolism protein UlaG (beta-lactamase superfamily)